MTDIIRPEDGAFGAVADANYQTPANATDNRAALQRFFDTLNGPYAACTGLLSGSYGWRLGPNGEGLNLTNKPGVTLRGVTTEGAINRSSLHLLPGGPAGQVAYDWTGARSIDIEGVDFNCDDAPELTAIHLFAASAAGECGRIKLKNSTISGNTRAAIYCYGVEKITIADDSWIVVNGQPTSSAAIWATNDNPLGLASRWAAIHIGPLSHATGLAIEGGFVWNNSAHDAYAIILSGARVVTIHHADLIAREAGIKIIGSAESGLVTVDDGTRFSSNDNGFLRYWLRQDTACVVRGVRLDQCEGTASEAIYGALVPVPIVGLELGQFNVSQPGALVPVLSLPGPYGGTQLWNCRINAMDLNGQRHPINVGGSIDATNHLYSPGPVSAPGGTTARVW